MNVLLLQVTESSPGNYSLLWPVGFFVVASCICAVLFFLIRGSTRKLLSKQSKNGRLVLFLVSAGLLPLLFGAWADIIDVSAVIDGIDSDRQLWLVCVIAAAVPVYMLVQALWFDHEEDCTEAIEKSKSEILRLEASQDEVRSQRDFLIRGMKNNMSVISTRHNEIKKLLTETPEKDRLPPPAAVLNVEEQLNRYIMAARETFTEYLDASSNLRVLHLIEDKETNSLKPSFCDGREPQLKFDQPALLAMFSMQNPTNSSAVEAAMLGTIVIDSNCEAAHSDPKASFNYQNCEPNPHDRVKSMISIPFEVDRLGETERHVVCLDTDQEDAFSVDFEWNARRIQENLSKQASFLYSVKDLLDR